MTELAGRTAFVTGGGSGIGRGLAVALAAEGVAVAVADILPERAESVADEIARGGGSAIGLACDVSDRASVRDAKEKVQARLGAVSLLFANAGVTSVEPLADLSPDHFDWITEVNLWGVSNCLQAFLPEMIAARAGHVVATASMAGLIPSWLPCHVPYTAAKAGVIGMMLNLRMELAESGVGCTVLCPGGVATRIHETPRYRPARFGGPSKERLKAAPRTFVQHTEKLQFRPPEEVAQMVLAAVRADRAMVVTDASQREIFVSHHVDVVLSAFDDAAAFDRAKDA